ncbi:MAG: hypothetical protein WC494_02380 [Candidatus Pacearchaeota archaeon]
MEKRLGKKGQVTIFIILGIVIIAGVLVFFFWIKPNYISEESGALGFEGCIKTAIRKSVIELEKNAGYINPEFTYNDKGEKIVYLCYTNEYYQSCVVQVPFLKQHFEENLRKATLAEVEVCYEDSVSELRDEGYEVVEGKINYNVSIEPEAVGVFIEAPTSVGSQKFSRFNVKINSPLYDILMISTSVLQFEARYGDTDTDSLNDFYPDYFVSKMKMSEGTTIYKVTSKIFEDEFKFASRSIVFPAGYGWE